MLPPGCLLSETLKQLVRNALRSFRDEEFAFTQGAEGYDAGWVGAFAQHGYIPSTLFKTSARECYWQCTHQAECRILLMPSQPYDSMGVTVSGWMRDFVAECRGRRRLVAAAEPSSSHTSSHIRRHNEITLLRCGPAASAAAAEMGQPVSTVGLVVAECKRVTSVGMPRSLPSLVAGTRDRVSLLLSRSTPRHGKAPWRRNSLRSA